MRIVAVSQRVDIIAERNERRDALDQRLAAWLAQCGLLAAPVPNQPALLSAWLAQIEPVGVVLSGGNDIGTAPERDAVEQALLDWAKAGKQPVLGICRGMQMMAVAAGGRLVKIHGHIARRHDLRGEYAGTVNSFHDWGLMEVPQGYAILATCADDGSVEAMRHHHLDWEGWMWHPEREATFTPADLVRLHRLFTESSETNKPTGCT